MDMVDEMRERAILEEVEARKSNASRMVWVTFSFEGIHAYPAAAETNDEGHYDVSFLQYPHRHIFHFKVWIEVTHNDRDIEFIQFKRWCQSQFSSTDETIQLNNLSCEMISDNLYTTIATNFPDRNVWIEISEDKENGTIIKYERRPVAKLS